jgi:hypothetical protein
LNRDGLPGVTAVLGGKGGTVLGGEAAAVELQASRLRKPIRGTPVEVARGVRKARSAPVARNRNAAALTDGG